MQNYATFGGNNDSGGQNVYKQTHDKLIQNEELNENSFKKKEVKKSSKFSKIPKSNPIAQDTDDKIINFNKKDPNIPLPSKQG